MNGKERNLHRISCSSLTSIRPLALPCCSICRVFILMRVFLDSLELQMANIAAVNEEIQQFQIVGWIQREKNKSKKIGHCVGTAEVTDVEHLMVTLE